MKREDCSNFKSTYQVQTDTTISTVSNLIWTLPSAYCVITLCESSLSPSLPFYVTVLSSMPQHPHPSRDFHFSDITKNTEVRDKFLLKFTFKATHLSASLYIVFSVFPPSCRLISLCVLWISSPLASSDYLIYSVILSRFSLSTSLYFLTCKSISVC